MKFLTLVASLIMSVSAFAGLADVSWTEIQNNRARYFVDSPGAFFLNSNPRALGTVYKRFVSVDGFAKVCVAGDKIYGGTVQSCVKMKNGGRDGGQCVETEANQLWAPLSGTRQICARHGGRDGECREWKTVSYNIDTNVSVKVYDQTSMDRDNDSAGYLGIKKFQLPACD